MDAILEFLFPPTRQKRLVNDILKQVDTQRVSRFGKDARTCDRKKMYQLVKLNHMLDPKIFFHYDFTQSQKDDSDVQFFGFLGTSTQHHLN